MNIDMVLCRIENGTDPALHCVGSVQNHYTLRSRCGDFAGEDQEVKQIHTVACLK